MVGMIMKILRRGFFLWEESWLVVFSGDGERVGGCFFLGGMEVWLLGEGFWQKIKF